MVVLGEFPGEIKENHCRGGGVEGEALVLDKNLLPSTLPLAPTDAFLGGSCDARIVVAALSTLPLQITIFGRRTICLKQPKNIYYWQVIRNNNLEFHMSLL